MTPDSIDPERMRAALERARGASPADDVADEMLALAIDTIEQTRAARKWANTQPRTMHPVHLPEGVKEEELDKTDNDDVIGMWGVDMAASEEAAQ